MFNTRSIKSNTVPPLFPSESNNERDSTFNKTGGKKMCFV